MEDVLKGVIRHLLTTLGGAGLVISEGTTETIAAGLIAMGGVAWSIYSKKGKNNETL